MVTRRVFLFGSQQCCEKFAFQQQLRDFAGCKTSFSMDVVSSASEWVSPPIKKPLISSIWMNMVVGWGESTCQSKYFDCATWCQVCAIQWKTDLKRLAEVPARTCALFRPKRNYYKNVLLWYFFLKSYAFTSEQPEMFSRWFKWRYLYIHQCITQPIHLVVPSCHLYLIGKMYVICKTVV